MAQPQIKLLLTAKDNASKVLRLLGKSAGETSKGISNIGSVAKKMGKTVAIAGAAAVGALGAISAASVGLAKDAAKGMELESFFIKTFGKDMEESLDVLRDASRGTVADVDLMASANRAALLGVTDKTETLAKIMEVARLRGKAMGLDTTTAFNDIVTGIGRGSPLILDNLGIKIPDAFKEATKEMGETEKQQALVNLVLEDGAKLSEELGGDMVSAADAFDQVKAGAANFKRELGKKLLPIVLKAMEFFRNLKEGILGFFELVTTDDAMKFGIFLENLGLDPAQVDKILTFAGKIAGKIRDVMGEIKRFADIVRQLAKPLIDVFRGGEGAVGRFILVADNLGISGDKAKEFAEKVEEMGKKVRDIASKIVNFFKGNWKPILVGVLTVVITLFALWAIKAIAAAVATMIAMAPIILLFAAIGVAAALLYKAWTENWGGIQEKVRAVADWLQGTALPIFQQAIEGIKKVIAILVEYWTTVLAPVIQNTWESNIKPAIESLKNAFQTIVPVIEQIAEFLIPIIKTLAQLIIGFFAIAIPAAIKIFGVAFQVVAKVIEVIAKVISLVFESLKTAILTAVDYIKSVFEGFKTAWKVVGFVFNSIKTTITTAINYIKSVFQGFGTAFEKVVNFVLNYKNKIVEGFNFMRDQIAAIFSGVSEVIKTAMNGIINVINNGIRKVNEMIDKLRGVPKVGELIPDINIPEIPNLAQGGEFVAKSPTLFVAGEGGEPEKVRVTPLSRMGQVGEGGNININFQGDVIVDNERRLDDLVRKIELALGNNTILELRGAGI